MKKISEFEYSLEKDDLLKKRRGIGFEDVIDAIENGGLIKNVKHPNRIKYPHQWMYIVRIGDYIWSVPYVITDAGKSFLKTVYPNRQLKKKYEKT